MIAATPMVRRPEARLRAGRFMQVIAALGVVVGIAGAIVGWQLVGQIDTTLDESLQLTDDTLVTLEDTIALADTVVDSVDDGLVAAEGSLNDLVTSFEEVDDVVDEIDELVATVGPSIDEVSVTLRDLAVIMTTIDDVLEQLDDIPFGPNYDPTLPLGEQFISLADDLDPIVVSLESTSGELSEFGDSTDDLATNLARFADSVGDLNADLQSSRLLLDDYLATARRAQTVTAQAQADLGNDVATTRVLVVFAGIILALGQIVPFWVGRELTVSARDELTERNDQRPPALGP